jgi:hypothetical protein
MSASVYTLGFGSFISYATITAGTPGTYTKITQTRDVNSPMSEVGDVKVTNNDSPNNCHEYAPGLIEPGDIEWDCVFTKTQFETVSAFLGNGIVYSFKETFPVDSAAGTAPTCTFPGYFKSIGVESKTEDEAVIAKFKVKLTGLPVWA